MVLLLNNPVIFYEKYFGEGIKRKEGRGCS